MEFGAWDGLSFAQIRERYPDDLTSWLGNLDFAPTGRRVVPRWSRSGCSRAATGSWRSTPARPCWWSATSPRSRRWSPTRSGRPLDALYQMELSPASVTVISYFRGGYGGNELLASLRLFNARPTDAPFTI